MDRIKVGYRIAGNVLIPFYISLISNPHWLICGPSGSGKSYLLKYLFWSLLQLTELEIFCCDFKNSGDYSFLDADHLAVGMACTDMLSRFYKRYTEIKESNQPNRILLVFDEWAAYSMWVESYDKKVAKISRDQIAEVLMMGRKLGSNCGGAYIWTVLQRPDAVYFGSSRDNYFVKIIMKDVTKSIRTMLDLAEDDIPAEHIARPGHGVCILDDSIYPIVVPTYNAVAMDALLTAEREQSRQQG